MADRRDEARNPREVQEGDVIGIGNITPGTEDLRNRSEESDEARRRRRMREGADDLTGPEVGTDVTPQRSGASTIDMGSGGEGTDIER